MALVEATCANGRPIQELGKLIEARSKWLNETAEQSCAACMIDVLVSLRALTKVAKPNKKEIAVSETNLKPSLTSISKGRYQFCLRIGKTRYVPKRDERIVRVTQHLDYVGVYKWYDSGKRTWLIVALDKDEAIEWAYEKLKKRAERYKGLARTAFSLLMKQTGSKTSPNTTNALATQKASTLTIVSKTRNGNAYSIKASDMLDYAKLALKGGDSAINQAIMKASNKIASVINHKAKLILMFDKLDTPFPELRNSK